MPETNQDAAAIDVHDLSKRFGRKLVVDRVSLRVEQGEIYGFLGPNGSGKTTCIRLMCGLLTPDSGSGTCLGFDILRESAAIKRRVGYMTQKFSFWDDLSIRQNLHFVARLFEMKERRAAVAATMEKMGLGSRAEQLAGSLSGGWKQRLALAACMLHQPELLLLDEPTAGVDPMARRDFWDELHRLAASGQRHFDPGQHALHGRGRTLPQAGLYCLWPTAGHRYGPGDCGRAGAGDPGRDRVGSERPGGTSEGSARCRADRDVRRGPARKRQGRARAAGHAAAGRLAGPGDPARGDRPGRRLHRPDEGRATDNLGAAS